MAAVAGVKHVDRVLAAAHAFRDAQAAWEAADTPRPAKVAGRWQPEPTWDAMRGAELDLLDAAMALPAAPAKGRKVAA